MGTKTGAFFSAFSECFSCKNCMRELILGWLVAEVPADHHDAAECVASLNACKHCICRAGLNAMLLIDTRHESTKM